MRRRQDSWWDAQQIVSVRDLSTYNTPTPPCRTVLGEGRDNRGLLAMAGCHDDGARRNLRTHLGFRSQAIATSTSGGLGVDRRTNPRRVDDRSRCGCWVRLDFVCASARSSGARHHSGEHSPGRQHEESRLSRRASIRHRHHAVVGCHRATLLHLSCQNRTREVAAWQS